MAERDVIVSINRQPVTNVDELKKIQSMLKPGDAVAFRVMRSAPMGTRGGTAATPQGLWLSGTLPRE